MTVPLCLLIPLYVVARIVEAVADWVCVCRGEERFVRERRRVRRLNDA